MKVLREFMCIKCKHVIEEILTLEQAEELKCPECKGDCFIQKFGGRFNLGNDKDYYCNQYANGRGKSK